MTSPPEWTTRIEEWRRDAEALSYEEALQAVDLLLADLQSDTVPLADPVSYTHLTLPTKRNV